MTSSRNSSSEKNFLLPSPTFLKVKTSSPFFILTTFGSWDAGMPLTSKISDSHPFFLAVSPFCLRHSPERRPRSTALGSFLPNMDGILATGKIPRQGGDMERPVSETRGYFSGEESVRVSGYGKVKCRYG